jgi:GNAT superfamily N-acetyltransferase
LPETTLQARRASRPCPTAPQAGLVPSDSPGPGTFEAIFRALEASSEPLIGRAVTKWLVIPLHDDSGAVVGGLWGCTNFNWLHVQMLVVPEARRGRGIGTALMEAAEAEARARGCRGAHVDTFSFQAVSFYRALGYSCFGTLEDYPPGHSQLYFYKRFAEAADGPGMPTAIAR